MVLRTVYRYPSGRCVHLLVGGRHPVLLVPNVGTSSLAGNISDGVVIIGVELWFKLGRSFFWLLDLRHGISGIRLQFSSL